MYLEVQCNGKLNQIGADFSNLRFSVHTKEIEAVKFVEYEFFKEEEVKIGKIFRKEKVSGRFFQTAFDGFEIGEKLFYRAVVTTATEEKYTSELYFVERGLSEKELVGQWIGSDFFDGRVMEFSKAFVCNEKITKARLYIVGLGFYTSEINGKATDDGYFKPILTDFDERRNLKNNPHYDEENFAGGRKTVCYDSYDVTGLIQTGENELKVLLGTGWYCNTDKDHVDSSFTFGEPKLFFELHLEGEEGKTVIKSDESCLVRNTAIKSQMFAGDYADFTASAEEFCKAKRQAPPTGKLVPSRTENDCVFERLQPLSCKREGNTLLYDFGKNHTGGLRLKVKGERGTKLKITYYEVLLEDGNPNPHTCRWIAYLDGKYPIGYIDQQGEYILSGGMDEIAPLFHWNCYRYAVVELPEGCEILEMESLFITAKMEQDGEFRCAWEILNDIHEAFILTQRDNMHCGVPSDCPHREKLPYTGDGQLVAESALYAFGAENFYRKWIKDIVDAQGKNGWVPYTAPYISGGGGYWWCNAVSSVALTLYKVAGDKSILREVLQPALRLIEFYGKMHDGEYIIKRSCAKWLLGDWLAPEVIASNISYINTLAYYSVVLQTKEIAEVLSEKAVVAEMTGLLEKIKNAINETFFDREKLQYGNGVQGEDLLPFVYGIIPEGYEDSLWEKVKKHYQTTGCFDTGIVLTPVLLEVLTARGEIGLALKILNRKEYPSFTYLLDGDTTFCEHWSKYWPKVSSAEGEEEVLAGDVSHCHPMYGSVVAWLYKSVAGLDLSEFSRGKILFAPKAVGIVQHSFAKKQTPYGEAAIDYDNYGGLKIKITAPYGVESELRLPLCDCKEFYASNAAGKLVKSRKRGNCVYAKLTGGEWTVTAIGAK